MEYQNSYLKNNDYTFISKDVKGRYQGVVVSHIDDYAIPKLVYGILYVQDHFNLGVDWYPGESLETVESHRDIWLSQVSDKPLPVKLNANGEVLPNYGGTTEVHQTRYGPTE